MPQIDSFIALIVFCVVVRFLAVGGLPEAIVVVAMVGLMYARTLIPRGVTDKQIIKTHEEMLARVAALERSMDAMLLKNGMKPDPRRAS